MAEHTADTQLPEVVRELYAQFGAETFVLQATKDDVPTLWVGRDKLVEVLRFLRHVSRPYSMLYDLSAMDERLRQHRYGLPAADFTVFYHLLSIERNSDVRIKVALSADSLHVPSVINIWPNANWYEREVWDLFGIEFDGHPLLVRIMLPRTWTGHPLRKDYPARATEFDPFMLDAAKQDAEQEALRFNPEEWGMKRGTKDEDFMFLNLGPNHPSAHGAFRIVLQLDGEEIIDVGEYYGSNNLEKTSSITYSQLKHSTVHANDPFPPSKLKNTIEGFAKRYKALVKQLGKDKVQSIIRFNFVSNRPISEDFYLSIQELKETETVTNANNLRKLEEFTGLKNKDLIDLFKLIKFQTDEDNYLIQRESLTQEIQYYLAGADISSTYFSMR